MENQEGLPVTSLRALHLVGDKIKAQLPHPRLISITELERLIDAMSVNDRYEGSVAVLLGQGISEDRYQAACSRVNELGLQRRLLFLPEKLPAKAAHALTHKHKTENIAITEPEAVGDCRYLAKLMVDEAGADMSDHLTGSHIQGMVIIEAARQMLLAVSEKYLVPASERGRLRFVTHRMDVRFAEFILPIDVAIECLVMSYRVVAAT